MIIYQLHQLHGKHICYNQIEANYNNTKGWKTVTEDAFYAEYKKVSPGVESVIDDLEDRYEKKFGKRPDKRKKRDTIEEELNADSNSTY